MMAIQFLRQIFIHHRIKTIPIKTIPIKTIPIKTIQGANHYGRRF